MRSPKEPSPKEPSPGPIFRGGDHAAPGEERARSAYFLPTVGPIRLAVGVNSSAPDLGGGMLTFNQLLNAAGLDPADVRLVRHRDPRAQRAVFEAAMNADQRFDEYQESQGAELVITQFRATTYLAAFVVEPITSETIFAGIWERLGERPPPVPGTPISLSGTTAGSVAFETRRSDALADYRGRIVIEWGDGARAWVQRADRQDKPIVEVRRERQEAEFPGFLDLRLPLDRVPQVPPTWAVALRCVRGVYLLVHRESGDQYVGAAYGSDGFFGRWLCYADGHAGNIGMRELGATPSAYDASILEIVGSAATIEDVCGRETLWKTKLGSRARA